MAMFEDIWMPGFWESQLLPFLYDSQLKSHDGCRCVLRLAQTCKTLWTITKGHIRIDSVDFSGAKAKAAALLTFMDYLDLDYMKALRGLPEDISILPPEEQQRFLEEYLSRIVQMPRLEFLHISQFSGFSWFDPLDGDLFIRHLTKRLSDPLYAKTLRFLNLSDWAVHEEAAADLLRTLELRPLEELMLNKTVRAVDWPALVAFVQNSPQLRRLELRDCGLGDDFLKALGGALLKPGLCLELLCLASPAHDAVKPGAEVVADVQRRVALYRPDISFEVDVGRF